MYVLITATYSIKYYSKSHRKDMEKSLAVCAQLLRWHGAGWEEQWQGSEHSCGMLHWFDRKGTIQGSTINNHSS